MMRALQSGTRSVAMLLLCTFGACVTVPKAPSKGPPLPALLVSVQPKAAQPRPAKPSATPLLFQHATVLTAAGQRFDDGHLLIDNGKIVSVGAGLGDSAVKNVKVIDATGMYLTPGLIDTHSHNGVYPSPGTQGNADGNEATAPITAQVRSQDGFWPQDPNLWRAISGGITSLQVLPGSANLIGGRSFVAHLIPGASALDMRFPGAPEGLKMACGENPKRVYGGKNQMPSTRMGNVAVLRAALQRATEYRRALAKNQRDLKLWQDKQDKKRKGESVDNVKPATPGGEEKPDDPPEPPPRDFLSETLVELLDGKILLQNHCYRADEMHLVLDLAKEFGFKVRSFHHAVEAYKLAERLAKEDVAVSTWVDWWGFKMESFDGLPQNVALLQKAGARPILHSDSPTEIRRLNQEAAKARAAGAQFGLTFSDDQVLRWVTANPAWALGIEDKVGTLQPGKIADVVLWNASPFSVYALAQLVVIDGNVVFDRKNKVVPYSDFELGMIEEGSAP